jgi:hypothetical protein
MSTIDREREKVAHDPGGALRLAENRFESPADCVFEALTLRQTFCPTEYRGQGVVELVRDP